MGGPRIGFTRGVFGVVSTELRLGLEAVITRLSGVVAAERPAVAFVGVHPPVLRVGIFPRVPHPSFFKGAGFVFLARPKSVE